MTWRPEDWAPADAGLEFGWSMPDGAVYNPERVRRFLAFVSLLRHVKGRWAGLTVEFEQWQLDEIVCPLIGLEDSAGARWYTQGLIGLARKNGKSTVFATIALYLLVFDGEWGAEVYAAAGDKEQARIVFGTARDMVRGSPEASAALKVYRDAVEFEDTSSIFRVLSADGPLKHGLNPSAVVIDELHVHRDPELYYALVTGSAARREPIVLSITTAGYDGKSLCRQVFDYGMRGSDPRFFFYWRQAPDDCAPDDPAAWRTANPASWITDAFLAEQFARLPLNVFRRLHLNQWTRTERVWLPVERWDACAGAPALEDGMRVVAAIDAAPKHDSTALTIGYRDDEGVVHSSTRFFDADESSGLLDFAMVEDAVRDLARRFDLSACLYDPFHFTRSAISLQDEGILMVEFPQNDSRMVPASQALFNLVVEGRLRHGGDRRLREQAMAAAAKETSRGWRLHKLMSSGQIDGIVTHAMLADLLENEAPAPVPRVSSI